MTYEEIKALAEGIIEDLRKTGKFYSVELLDHKPGDSLPICCSNDDGDFVLELNTR